MRWPGCSWQPIPVGHRGEHQLELVEDMGILNSDTEYAKILVPDDRDNHVDFGNPLAVDDVLAFDDGDMLAEHLGALERTLRQGIWMSPIPREQP